MLRRSYLALLGTIILSLVLYFALPAGPSLRLRSLVTQLFSPVLSMSTAFQRWWDASRQEVQSRTALLQQNHQLREQLALQMQERLRLTELEDENRRLRDMAGFRQAVGPRLKPARITGRDPSNWWKTIILDIGSSDGVTENCAVVTTAGLVGKTVAVTGGTSRVQLIVDPNCKVSALVQETRSPGIVEGVFEGLGGEPGCRMDFIGRDAKVFAKYTVITSGLGGVFPKGIRIGTLEPAALNESGLYKSARIKPAVDLNRLEEVFVICR
ncbi:MAG: rod shape-determining protein MreC [Verrucomicrobia bacterium]|nr:rod shape-determining protein MreC [Verrucomicrobiota bacterium]